MSAVEVKVIDNHNVELWEEGVKLAEVKYHPSSISSINTVQGLEDMYFPKDCKKPTDGVPLKLDVFAHTSYFSGIFEGESWKGWLEQRPPTPEQIEENKRKFAEEAAKATEILDQKFTVENGVITKVTIISESSDRPYDTRFVDGIRYVTDPTKLIANMEYWLVDKILNTASIQLCRKSDNSLYFGDRIWASPTNNQAMDRYDIYGPLPVRREPDFKYLKKLEGK